MGYLRNHLATVVTGVFAAVLSGLWPILGSTFPVLNFVFTMAVPIAWFLTVMCYLAQKSADYMHKHGPRHDVKKKLNNPHNPLVAQATSTHNITTNELNQTKTRLGTELEELRHTVKLKDDEIEQLKQKIESLETLVQIESLKTELANLKVLASKEKTKRKAKRK